MTLFLVSFVFIGLVMAGMAIGVMSGRGPLKGSCGGMGALGIDTACDICGGNVKIVACIENADVIEKILKHLGLDEASQARNRSPPSGLFDYSSQPF